MEDVEYLKLKYNYYLKRIKKLIVILEIVVKKIIKSIIRKL